MKTEQRDILYSSPTAIASEASRMQNYGHKISQKDVNIIIKVYIRIIFIQQFARLKGDKKSMNTKL